MTKNLQRAAWVAAVALFVIGLYGLYQRFTLGHASANYGSYIPWGLWIAAYVYLIGLSAGAFLFSTMVYVFNVQRSSPEGRSQLESVGRLALFIALVTLVAAMITVWLDLGHPLRAWRLFLATNFGSVMGWLVWLYAAYFLLLVGMLWLALRPELVRCGRGTGFRAKLCSALVLGKSEIAETTLTRDRWLLRLLGAIGIPFTIGFYGAEGALFGVVGARPYWHGGLTPIVFLVGGLTSGGALLAFVNAVWGQGRGTQAHRDLMALLGKLVLGLLLLDLLLVWAEYSIGLYSSVPAEADSIRAVLFGEYWWAFWVVQLALGAVIPLLLLVFRGRSVWAVATAGALIAIAFLAVRLNIVLPGLALEELEGLRTAFTGPGLTFSYFPSSAEWLVFLWTVSLAGLLFLIGYNLLPIVTPTEEVA